MSLAGLSAALAAAEHVSKTVVRDHAATVDAEAQWPEPGMRALQKAGLGGLVVPTDCSGMGLGLLALVRVCETISQQCASTSMCFGMHAVGSAVISAKATAAQKRDFLEPISVGEHLTTLALSEPGSGAHFYFPETRLTQDESGHFELNGQKSFVTNGAHADSYVISTLASDAEGNVGRFSCVVAPHGTPRMNWGTLWNGVGMRGNASRTLELAGCRVPVANLLGEEGDQIWYVFEVVAPYFLMAMAGTYLGVAEASLQDAILHLKDRRYSHSGGTLADHPVLQHRIGTLWAELEQTRQLVYRAATLGDAADERALPYILSAKAQVADTAVRVVNEAMTLQGGAAYAQGSPMSRHLRDIRAAHVMAPTTDILRTWAGRALLDLPLLGD